MRALYLLLATILIALSVLSTQLASRFGFLVLPLTVALFGSSWWYYFRASFPPGSFGAEEPGTEPAPSSGAAGNRVVLLAAVGVIALFAPIWAWIVPLFALQAAYRAHRKGGDFGEAFRTELNASWRFLRSSAVNTMFLALSTILAVVTVVGTSLGMYFLAR